MRFSVAGASIESIESLAWSLNRFHGGVVIVSHDERLIKLVADEIWVVKKGRKAGQPGTVQVFPGDYDEYRRSVLHEMVDLGLIDDGGDVE